MKIFKRGEKLDKKLDKKLPDKMPSFFVWFLGFLGARDKPSRPQIRPKQKVKNCGREQEEKKRKESRKAI